MIGFLNTTHSIRRTIICILGFIGLLVVQASDFGANLVVKSNPAPIIVHYDSKEDTYETLLTNEYLSFDYHFSGLGVLANGRLSYASSLNGFFFATSDGEYEGYLYGGFMNSIYWYQLLSIPQEHLIIVDAKDADDTTLFFGIFSDIYPNPYFLCDWLSHNPDILSDYIYYPSESTTPVYLCGIYSINSSTATGLTEPVIGVVPQSISLSAVSSPVGESYLSLDLIMSYYSTNFDVGRYIRMTIRNDSLPGVPSIYNDTLMQNYPAEGLELPVNVTMFMDFEFLFDTIPTFANTYIHSRRVPGMDGHVIICNRDYGVVIYDTATGNQALEVIAPGTDSIDVFACEFDYNGYLYFSDYSGFAPIRVYNSSWQLETELGPFYGSLGSSLDIAFFPGPYAWFSSVLSYTESNKVGNLMTFVVELRDSSNLTYDSAEYSTDKDVNGVDPLPISKILNVVIRSIVAVGGELFSSEIDISEYAVPIGDGRYQFVYNPTLTTVIAKSFIGNSTYYSYDSSALGASVNQSELESMAETYASELEVRVGLSHMEIRRFPLFYVLPGNATTSTSVVVPTSYASQAGDTNSVIVTLHDHQGNRLYDGGMLSSFSFTANDEEMIHDMSSNKFEALGCSVELFDVGDGSYALDIFASITGITLFRLFLDGVEFPEAITAVVLTAEIEGNSSEASGEGLYSFDIGTSAFIDLKPKDKFLNLAPYSSDYDTVSNPLFMTYILVDSPSESSYTETTVMSTTYLTDGSWNIEYMVDVYRLSDGSSISTNDGAKAGAVYFAFFCTSDGSYIVNPEQDSQSGDNFVLFPGGILVPESSVFASYQQSVYSKLAIDTGSVSGGDTFLSVGIIETVVSALLVIWWRNENVIKFSQINFLYVILLGVLLGFISPLIISEDGGSNISTSECVGFTVCLNLSVLLITGGLLVKTWRISKIANNTNLRKLKLSDGMLLKILGVIVSIGSILITLAVTLGNPIINNEVGKTSTSSENSEKSSIESNDTVKVCNFEHSGYFLALIAYQVFLVGYCVVLAYNTRKVHTAFAENKWIVLSVYNFAVVGTLTLILYFVLDLRKTNPGVAFIILSIGVFVCIGGVLHLIFLPKFYSIISGEEVTAEDFIVQPTKRDSTGRTSSRDYASRSVPDMDSINAKSNPIYNSQNNEGPLRNTAGDSETHTSEFVILKNADSTK